MLKRLASANKEGTHWVLPTNPRRKSSHHRRSCIRSEKKNVGHKSKKRTIDFSSPTYTKGGNTFLNRLISANGEGGYWTTLAVRGRRKRVKRSGLPSTPRSKTTPRRRSTPERESRQIRRENEVTPRPVITTAAIMPDNWTPEAKKVSSRVTVEVDAPVVTNLVFETASQQLTKEPFEEFKKFMVKLFRHRDSCTVDSIVNAFVMSQNSSKSQILSMLSKLENANKFMVHQSIVYAI